MSREALATFRANLSALLSPAWSGERLRLATALGVPMYVVTRLLEPQRRHLPPPPMLAQIADHFSLTPDDLLNPELDVHVRHRLEEQRAELVRKILALSERDARRVLPRLSAAIDLASPPRVPTPVVERPTVTPLGPSGLCARL